VDGAGGDVFRDVTAFAGMDDNALIAAVKADFRASGLMTADRENAEWYVQRQ